MGLLSSVFQPFVFFAHHLAETGHFLVVDGGGVGGIVVVVVLEERWEDVAWGLSLWVAHSEHGGVGAFCHELVLQAVAVAVASDDAAHLPEAEVVEELTTGDAYLAHEQLVDVVGGG